MSLRVLIVPDKFKGTLTAHEAAAAIAAGWSRVRPGDLLELTPMADGGDGFGQVVGQLLMAERRTCATVDAAGRGRRAQWWFEPNSRVAVIEAAQVNGLALLPVGKHHPFQLDTFGIGAVLKAAESAGAMSVYLGLGGSATNDGGFGMARSLGWSFWDASGNELVAWTELTQLARVSAPAQPLVFDELTLAVDVDNPLLGPKGATRVYGPQKGLRDESDLLKAEACLQRLAEVMGARTPREAGNDAAGPSATAAQAEPGAWATDAAGAATSAADTAGAGAAGGLGFGLKAFCGGAFASGAEIFSKLAHLDQRIESADLVITAEGRIDAQSLMGKGTGMIAQKAAAAGKRCLCLAASISPDTATRPWPHVQALAIVPRLASLQEAMARPKHFLSQLAAKAAAELE